MRAQPGYKWTIILTAPSGNKYVCAGRDGLFALVPIGNGKQALRIEGAIAFDDSKDASEWMKNFTGKMNQEQRDGFFKMKPDLGMIATNPGLTHLN